MYKTSQEFNNRLLQHNSCLQPNLETTNEAHKRLETEKSSIVEHLSTVRGHKKALQEQLASLKVSYLSFVNAIKSSFIFLRRLQFIHFIIFVMAVTVRPMVGW
jgi:predicted nuclease with TOPRIM domain